jgi:hypothetical protein
MILELSTKCVAPSTMFETVDEVKTFLTHHEIDLTGEQGEDQEGTRVLLARLKQPELEPTGRKGTVRARPALLAPRSSRAGPLRPQTESLVCCQGGVSRIRQPGGAPRGEGVRWAVDRGPR